MSEKKRVVRYRVRRERGRVREVGERGAVENKYDEYDECKGVSEWREGSECAMKRVKGVNVVMRGEGQRRKEWRKKRKEGGISVGRDGKGVREWEKGTPREERRQMGR